MKIVAADWLPYRLPFKQAWQTANGLLCEREGALLRLKTEDGLIGWGDAAPLPEFGISETAARDFAEECAQLDLAAQRAGLNLASWLSGEPAPQRVTVNAVLGSIFSLEQDALARAITAGFRILKLKVGIGPVADEIRQLQALSSMLPAGIQWRLDANAAWSASDAHAFILSTRDLPIEGLEEPLREPSQHGLRELQALAPYPLAIDESTHLLDQHFWHAPSVQRLIIKPARCGGLLASMELALRARAAGLEVIMTSSLESACGLTACAHLAAAVAPYATHGLASADWFAHDTGQAPLIANGQMIIPQQAGIGFNANSDIFS
jgi:O-succinylbenzoate synthase